MNHFESESLAYACLPYLGNPNAKHKKIIEDEFIAALDGFTPSWMVMEQIIKTHNIAFIERVFGVLAQKGVDMEHVLGMKGSGHSQHQNHQAILAASFCQDNAHDKIRVFECLARHMDMEKIMVSSRVCDHLLSAIINTNDLEFWDYLFAKFPQGDWANSRSLGARQEGERSKTAFKILGDVLSVDGNLYFFIKRNGLQFLRPNLAAFCHGHMPPSDLHLQEGTPWHMQGIKQDISSHERMRILKLLMPHDMVMSLDEKTCRTILGRRDEEMSWEQLSSYF